MISSYDLAAMPGLTDFRRLTRSLAALDAMMSPEWEHRYYSFDPSWGEGEMMASMRDGSGDRWFAIICSAGVAIVGLAHESPSYEPGRPHPSVFAGLPSTFKDNFLEEPAFDTSNATFCVWRLRDDEQWHSGASTGHPLPRGDGSTELLTILEGRPAQYREFAEEYFECEVGLCDILAVYEHRAVDQSLVARFNAKADAAAVKAELKKIGYPEL